MSGWDAYVAVSSIPAKMPVASFVVESGTDDSTPTK
jgi:hypothetical protein